MKLYVVATITDVLQEDFYADIILVTTDEEKAKDITEKLKLRLPIEGINYNNLVAFEDVNYFERTLNETINNEG